MRGEVLMETVIALPLLMVLLLGLGQQFLVTEAQLDHVRIAQEIMLGPQEPTVVFDPVTTPGAPFSTVAAAGFMSTITTFINSRIDAKTVVFLQLGYLNLDSTTGQVSSANGTTVLDSPTFIVGSGVGAQSGCRARGPDLTSYAQTQLSTMAGVTLSGSPPAVAPKLYDVTLGASTNRAYLPYLPFLFVLVCSEPVFGLWPQNPESRFMLAPRRLVN
jgi:hypothetical protein